MKIEFDIKRLVPRFIYDDKNGYAICMAIKTAMKYAAEKAEEGITIILDPDEMPEWRLDELAEDYNILYDYTADIELKREWIKHAEDFYALYGTAAGIVKYLEAAFDSASVEEWFKYGGDPFHFRVNCTGEWSEEAEAWAMKSINSVKNVRSVLDTITFNAGEAEAVVLTGAAVCGVDIAVDAEMM